MSIMSKEVVLVERASKVGIIGLGIDLLQVAPIMQEIIKVLDVLEDAYGGWGEDDLIEEGIVIADNGGYDHYTRGVLFKIACDNKWIVGRDDLDIDNPVDFGVLVFAVACNEDLLRQVWQN